MADEVDRANANVARMTRDAIERARKPAQRDPDFCDCESWQAGQFCGDVLCRDAYEKTLRLKAIRGSHSAEPG